MHYYHYHYHYHNHNHNHNHNHYHYYYDYCLNTETLLHVVAGCQSYLDRFTWRHDSILNFLAQTLQSIGGFE